MNVPNDTKSLLLRLVSAYTKHTDQIRIESTVERNYVQHTLHVHQEDYHKVVGRSGSRIKAISHLFGIIGRTHGSFVNIVLVPMPQSDRIESTPCKEDHNWNPAAVNTIIRQLMEAVECGCYIDSTNTAIATNITLKVPSGHYEKLSVAGYFTDMVLLLFAIGRKEGRMLYLDVVRA